MPTSRMGYRADLSLCSAWPSGMVCAHSLLVLLCSPEHQLPLSWALCRLGLEAVLAVQPITQPYLEWGTQSVS